MKQEKNEELEDVVEELAADIQATVAEFIQTVYSGFDLLKVRKHCQGKEISP